MTIHSAFWKERNLAARKVTLGCPVRRTRDSSRQRCYKWEWKELRPVQKKMDKEEAKGYARLCMKIAIRHMQERGFIRSDDLAAEVRASFKSAFTTEALKFCDGSSMGVYFAKWGWTDVVIAHEVAHWADQWAHRLAHNVTPSRLDYEAHGPRWRGWFIYILANAGLRTMPGLLDPLGFLQRSMTGAGLKYTMPETIGAGQ